MFGRGTVAGLTNQIAEGSFLLFLANLIGITVTSLVVFFAAALRLIPQLLAQSSGLVGIARTVEPAVVIGIA